jgi:hypothetical protein
MKKMVFFLTLALGIFSVTSFAQKVPSFTSYGTRIDKKRAVTVNLGSHKSARMFRTNLRNAAKEGVNFAGHYILTGWGCGTNCSMWAIIDARNGRVYFPREFEGVGFGFCELPEGKLPSDTPNLADDASGPLYFKANSRLVALTGFTGGGLDNQQAKCGNYFFEWTGNRLKRVSFVAGKRTDTP